MGLRFLFAIIGLMSIVGCNTAVEPPPSAVQTITTPCEQEQYQKQLLVAYTDYIMVNTPSIHNRPNGVVYDSAFALQVDSLMSSICEVVVASDEFREFAVVFLFSEYLNDLNCCNQSYNVLDLLTGVYAPIMERLLDENKHIRVGGGFFTSGQVTQLTNSIAQCDSNNMARMHFKVDSMELEVAERLKRSYPEN